ncbi:uncharacterized protein LOC143918077 [Arctopsyche grandis]|uniref:uncharacterized protein LOC143918077 n=1 Tax=Arctopsyche grandis TaxID=121162 RepID=UPI00406D9E90
MAALVKLLAIFLIIVCAHAYSLEKIETPDLEVGVKGPNDMLLFTQESSARPQAGITLEKLTIGMNNEFAKINYVSVKEIGGFCSARAYIAEGGPGYNFVVIDMIPGPPQAFNYTTEVWGEELEKSKYFKSVTRKFETKYYV